MPYKYRFTLPKHVALRKYRHLLLLLSALLFLILGCYLVFIWYISQENRIDKPQTDFKASSFNPLKTFDTPYFTLDTDKSWKFMEKESTDNKFVYRSFGKNIVKSDLIVYVDSLPKDLLLTRVLPVEPDDDRFIVGEVSGHCKTYLSDRIAPGNNNPIEGIVESVRIKCQVDGTSNTVGTGLKNGSYQTIL
ncbi:MAG TPA: hypothetical protein VFX86_00355, partial [Candidatus Saccharimonadales bacterium]|nr:hypothetical protein [Candidatus Saccharimonadales bacterium]